MSQCLDRTLRVVVIGGAGQMGRHTVRALATYDEIERIDIADLDIDRASKLAREVGPKAFAVQANATDRDDLERVFRDVDVVLNTMGPFARFGRLILETALEMGCNYLDIDDDWEATVEAFELDGLAADRNLTAVIGLGMSPGITNLLAVEAGKRLDIVDTALTGWKLASSGVVPEAAYDMPGAGSAAMQHWMLQCSGTVRSWRNGELTDVAPLERGIVNFPSLGKQTVVSCGHPEPITLPRVFPHLIESSNVMSGPDWLFEHVAEIARSYDREEIDLFEAAKLVASAERPADPSLTPKDPFPRVWAYVEGLTGSERRAAVAYLTAWPPYVMGGMTGYPLAVGAKMLALGQIDAKGVSAPEQAVDPRTFFAHLGSLTDPIRPNVDELLVVEMAEPGYVRL